MRSPPFGNGAGAATVTVGARTTRSPPSSDGAAAAGARTTGPPPSVDGATAGGGGGGGGRAHLPPATSLWRRGHGRRAPLSPATALQQGGARTTRSPPSSADNGAAREGKHVLLPRAKPCDGRGYCPIRDHGGCHCGRGRQAKVGDRVEAGEPPGERGQAFLTNGNGQEAAGTVSGRWVLHARGATTTT